MKKIRWIIQNNLIAENDLRQIQESCNNLKVEFEEVTVIPFLDKIPKFTIDNKENIYYGSTSFINGVYNSLNAPTGIFFNKDTFSMENYIYIWKDYMLNSNAKITSFGEFAKETYSSKELFFIRPDADDKAFEGQVLEFEKIKNWHKNFIQFDNANLSESTKILVGEAYNIEKEWRNYIVNGKVISSSLYRKNFKLNKSRDDVPKEMINFVLDRISEYQPHKAFAMDIALCGGDYYIIECGCINSVGFYASDINEIVKALTKMVESYG